MDNKLQETIENLSEETLEKSYDISVSISSDYLFAYLSLEVNKPNVKILKEDIIDAIKAKNVVFGIHTNKIDEIIAKGESVYDVEIAKGIQILNGKHGKITYNFDNSNNRKPEINEDGTVDFKHINFLIPAKKGDVLATRTMPTEGKDGTLVTGKVMKARNGKMVNFKIGKNVEISEDGLKAIAACDGSIKIDYEKFSVLHCLEIGGDVGIETGNIEFSGKVIINGNVNSGYEVKATEDIIIYGIIESAKIETLGNLMINHGVQGNEHAVINVGGDFVAKFINGATVDCKGSISADSIMHSDIKCGNIITAEGKNGLIIGGNVYAKNEVNAKCIGSKMGTTTFVTVGITPGMLNSYKKLDEEKKLLEEKLKKVDKVLGLFVKQGGCGKENLAVNKKSNDLKKEYEKEIVEIEKKMQRLSNDIKSVGKSVIKIKDIYPGTRIKVDNSFYSIKERILEVMFKKVNSKVEMLSLEE